MHEAGHTCAGLAWPALTWLGASLRRGMRTFETGVGASTIVFAAAGTEHEAVSPARDEHAAVLAECAVRGVPTDLLRFHEGLSHEVLAGRERRALDLVLIDGAHGFPYPVLDWWYLAPELEVGGLVVLDDAQMPPVGMLVDHLSASSSWAFETCASDRTVVFRKVDTRLPEFDWGGERLGGGMRFAHLPPSERVVRSVRFRLLDTAFGKGVAREARSLRRRAPMAG